MLNERDLLTLTTWETVDSQWYQHATNCRRCYFDRDDPDSESGNVRCQTGRKINRQAESMALLIDASPALRKAWNRRYDIGGPY